MEEFEVVEKYFDDEIKSIEFKTKEDLEKAYKLIKEGESFLIKTKEESELVDAISLSRLLEQSQLKLSYGVCV